jgi:opacity protein-like surface antigen
MKLSNLALLTFLAISPAMAQNSDLGILFSAAVVKFDFGTRTETQYRIGVQGNYALQLLERKAGRLYVEIPVSSYSGPVRQGTFSLLGALTETARPERVVFATPGLRYHFNLTRRFAVYAAVGGGIAWRQQKIFVFAPNGSPASTLLDTRTTHKLSGAFDAGAGVDFRLTRLLSLRGEFRTFRTSAQSGYGDGRTYPTGHIGLAFHF